MKRFSFGVSYQNTTDLGDFESLVVVLTKIKKKQIVVDRACQ
jgi:hypothetical protein